MNRDEAHNEAFRLLNEMDEYEALKLLRGSGASPCSPCFVVLAFRYGGHSNTFPIGVFPTREDAESAARAHRFFRGGKYDHRIYEFEAGKANDDVGHAANNRPCIEANANGDGSP